MCVVFSPNDFIFNRHGPMLRGQMQQPLNAEMLSQQQLMTSNSSPKRDGRTLLSQNIIHQSYGVAQQSASGISSTVMAAGSLIGAGIPVSGNSVGVAGIRQRPVAAPGIGNTGSGSNAAAFIPGNPNMTGILPQHLSMAYYSQTPPSQTYFGEVLHPTQVQLIHHRCFEYSFCKICIHNIFSRIFRHPKLHQNHDSLQRSVFNDWHRRFSDNCVKRRN